MISDKRICVTNVYWLVVIFAITNIAAVQAVKAVVVLSSSHGVTVTGTMRFNQVGNGSTTVTGNMSGMQPGGLYRSYATALGDTTNSCVNTGQQLVLLVNNISAGADGKANINVTIFNNQLPLSGPNSAMGKAVVVFTSAGVKVACGVMGTTSS